MRKLGSKIMLLSSKLTEYELFHQGIAFTGELASPLYPEENSSKVLGKKLIGIFAEPKVKWINPSLQLVGLSIGKYHVLAWSATGLIYSWGINQGGVVGIKDNGKNLNKIISTPALVDLELGSNPGVVYGLATKEASFVINFRGRIYYWGKIFEESDMVINSAERLDAKAQSSEEKTRFLKIIGYNNYYAAVSSKQQLYLLFKTQGDYNKRPELSLLDIPSEHPVSDIALTTRSVLILYSTASHDCMSELKENMAAMEFQKNKVLRTSDYLVREDTTSHDFDTKLKAKKSQPKKIRKNSENILVSIPSGPLSKEIEIKPTKKKWYQRLYDISAKFQTNLLNAPVRISSPKISKLHTNLKHLFTDDSSSRTDVLLRSIPLDLPEFPEISKPPQQQPPPALLPSDYDRRQRPSLSQVNYSHGSQARSVWISLVNEGLSSTLVDSSLRYLIDKKEIPDSEIRKTDDLPIKKNYKTVKQVKIRGLGLVDLAQRGKESAMEISNRIEQEKTNCKKLLSMVIFPSSE